MIDLAAITARWSAAFNDPAMIDALPTYAARQLLHQLVGDLHDVLRLAQEVRAYGRARIAMSEAFEALDGFDAALVAAHREARGAHMAALDRIEAIAVQLAGGDVRRVCGGDQ